MDCGILRYVVAVGEEEELFMSQTPVNAPVPERRRIKELEAMVADVIRETPDTTTLVLFTGNERLDYEAGHFLTVDPHQFEGLERFISFLEDLKGRKEPPRAYSMSSAPHERYIAITVKEERYVSGATKYPPLLSPLLVRRTHRGARMVITGFTGPYTLSNKILGKTDHLFHICAGSGSVPNFAIIKSALQQHPQLRHTLLYSNRTWEDVIFRNEIEVMARQYPDRLKVIHALTRETHLPSHMTNVRAGRVGLDLLKELVPPDLNCHFFVCGPAISSFERAAAKEKGVQPPPRFLESVLAGLKTLGVQQDQVTHESYG
jgi:3-ketosteroid 9alpha-monooxygenase subunit B